ncbi:MAG: class I SAM-dependent methyltransferase [Terriglobales bacterium]
MTNADRVMRVADAHRLENPERLKWLPPDRVLALLPLRPGSVVADIGAGTGFFAIPLARAVTGEGRVFAVDLQPGMLDLLRAKLGGDAVKTITLVSGSAQATTLADASCDIVFIANVWHELPDYAAALREFRRILKPGGTLAIVDWRPDVEQPPGPPLDHRIEPGVVRKTLTESRWRVQQAGLIGTYNYYALAKP